ncbi:MAG: PspC domain-containing protein [Bacteroidetes bacterium]|nr:PspC domain-containing protein [Bacteroidota bacterium]
MEPKKLYRSRTSNVIGGVAGGLGQYFSTDPVIVRLIFVALFLAGGGGLLIYILMWIFIPQEPFSVPLPSSNQTTMETEKPVIENPEPAMENKIPVSTEQKKSKGSLMGGAVLITLGFLFLIARFVPRIDFGDVWPILLVAIGAILIYNATYNKKEK